MATTEPPPLVQKPRRAHPVLLLTALLLVLLNTVLGYAQVFNMSHNTARATGSAMFSLLCPLSVAGLFSIGRQFRNPASWTKIVFWTSIVVLFGKFAQFAHESGMAR